MVLEGDARGCSAVVEARKLSRQEPIAKSSREFVLE